ncbi:MAG: hypothetical protein VX804_05640 [Candidatus Thermoplasmatota archaeon]|nr:hypothetical protein [Candidatus Thermoplasmatota archaeon]
MVVTSPSFQMILISSISTSGGIPNLISEIEQPVNPSPARIACRTIFPSENLISTIEPMASLLISSFESVDFGSIAIHLTLSL